MLVNCIVLIIIKPSTCYGDRPLIEYNIACNVNAVTLVFVNERYAYALSIPATDLIKACLSLLFAVADEKQRLKQIASMSTQNLIYNTFLLKLIVYVHKIIFR